MTPRKPGPVTGSELSAQLATDPDYQAARAAADAELEQRRNAWLEAEEPLARELKAAGYDVQSAWELRASTEPYPEALPILLRHLQNEYPDRVREGIARALAVPEASFAWPTLVRVYRSDVGPNTKDGVAWALVQLTTGTKLDDVGDLLREPSNGDSRILLLRALRQRRSAKAIAILESLREDPLLGTEVRRLLDRRRSVR